MPKWILALVEQERILYPTTKAKAEQNPSRMYLYFIQGWFTEEYCVSHATPYSGYVRSQKRLLSFGYFFLFFSDKDCAQ